MDRFIGYATKQSENITKDLKSNMDRFIANPRTKMITEGKI